MAFERTLQGVVPLPRYFTSEWSFAQFKIPDDCPTAAGFLAGAPHTLVVVTSAGSFYRATFDPVKGGACTQQSYCRFIDLDPAE